MFFQVNLLAAKAIHSYKSRSTALRFEMELEDWPVGSKVPIRTSPELEEFLLGSSESLMLVWCARRRLPFACEMRKECERNVSFNAQTVGGASFRSAKRALFQGFGTKFH